MTNFSKGPYLVSEQYPRQKNEYGAAGINIHGKLADDIATVWYNPLNKIDEAEAENTARLLAASYEMYEALKAIVRHGLIEKEGYETVVKMLNDAIRSAEHDK